jgi:small subunit ribosomal protein S18
MSDERSERSYAGGEGGGGGDRKFFAKPKFCQFCADKQLIIDYKKTDLLRKYVTEDGKIRPRRQTGACARHQRLVAVAVKQARHVALLPFSGTHADDRS